MIFEGSMSVIDAIKEKKRLMEKGEDHDHIQPLLIIGGGFMKGTYGIGAAMTMDELSFLKTFNSVVGISSGAPTVAYAYAGSIHIGASLMWNEFCTRKFLSFFRFYNILSLTYFRKTLEGETNKKLDCSRILSNKTDFYLGLSEYKTANPYLLKPTSSDQILSGIQASVAAPGAVSKKIFIDGVRYVDGASTRPHILRHVCETLDSTHILIITNQDKGTDDILWWDKFITKTLFRFRTKMPLRRVVINRRKIRHAWIEEVLATKEKEIGFVWGDGSIKSFEQDPKNVKDTIEKSRLWWYELLKD